jgi:hypothetical protein
LAVTAAYERIAGGVDRYGIHPFEKRVAEIRQRDKCGYCDALRSAREEHPDEFEDWQEQGA